MSDWLTYSPISGHGNGTITITADTLSTLGDKVATIIVSNSQYSLSASTSVSQKGTQPTAITFENVTWVTDVPASGGTADKNNCSYVVYLNYDNGMQIDVTSAATVSGSLVVPSTTADERQNVGTLSLTAQYSGFTTIGTVIAYQEAYAPTPSTSTPLTFKIISGGTIVWKSLVGNMAKTISYSKDDGITWTNINATTAGTPINVNTGDIVKFKGDNTKYSRNSFGGSAVFSAEGNIMSLIDSEGFATATTLDSELAFNNIFGSCTGLTSAENLMLPATILSYECYSFMFANCTSLTTPPKLPATTLTINCYSNMFVGCTSLMSAPELPATTLAGSCYESMFQGCTSLTTAPELPATTLAGNCYGYMFYGCSSLNYIKCLATTLANNSTGGWVEGVSPTGTFVKNPNMSSWPTGIDGIPEGWTVTNAS